MKEKKIIRENRRIEAIIDYLVEMPLFDDLVQHELSAVAGHMNFIEVEKGEVLFEEGDQGDYVCFVIEGTLEVIKRTSGGEDMVLATLSRGRSIGEMSVIDNTPRSATVRARSEATLVTMTRSGFDRILDQHPKIGIKILKGISRLLSLNMRKTSSRLADYMLPMG